VILQKKVGIPGAGVAMGKAHKKNEIHQTEMKYIKKK